MHLRFIVAAVIFFASHTSIVAATATPEEAQRLTGVFQTYLGREPGVVTVTPAGEVYVVKVDFAPLFARISQPGFKFEMSPMEMTLADQGSGKWLVTQDQAFSGAANVPGVLDLTFRIEKVAGSGIFDENLTAFSSSSSNITRLGFDETFITPGAGSSRVAYAIESMNYETTATAAAGGGVDATAKGDVAGLTQIMEFPVPGSDPVDVDVSVLKGTQISTVKGLRTKAILELIAFFVANPSPEAIRAGQPQLKNLLRAGLPFFENISTTGTLENLSVAIPSGVIGIAGAGFGVSLNGAVADGLFQEEVSVSGITLPPGLVPPWASALVPSSTKLDFKIADFNLRAPAEILIDNLDLANSPAPNPAFEQRLLAAFLPKGTVTMSMGPSEIIAKAFDISFDGSMTAGPVAAPVGQATIRARGIDRLMEILRAAPAEMGLQQAITGLVAAKGLSKQEPDGRALWKIETTPGGVLVNGIDPSKM